MKNWKFDELIEAVEEGFDSKKNYSETHYKTYTEMDCVFTAASATANDFTGPWLDGESEQMIVRLTLFMCVEKFGKIFKAVYENLEIKFNNYVRERLLDLTETEKDRIEEMIFYYKKRIKELDIVGYSDDDSLITYRLDEKNELKRVK